jgi:predicted chitinase
MRAQEFVTEISDERLQSYLSRAGQQVDRRQERMARVRDRLNKGYEIYHADRPAGSTQIVDRFEANTPALAQRYYEKFIHNYESDRDFDLRLRRATGIIEEGWKERIAAAGIGAAMTLGGQQALKQYTPTAPAQPQQQQQQQQQLTPKQILIQTAKQAGITGDELAQLLAQSAHETLNFTRMREAGTAEYFTKKYEQHRKTARILGNKVKGDGERYKGRGFIQLTGRDNYTRAGKALGLPLEANPELAAQPDNAAKIAVWYWQNRVAPKVQDFTNTKAVTKKINPALKHQDRRQQQFAKYQVAQNETA